jgi:hypothetical protein
MLASFRFSFYVSVTLVGSYFFVQWLANLILNASLLAPNCTSSQTAYTALQVLNFSVAWILSVVGTNLLCHRYLCEKARIMIKLYVDVLLAVILYLAGRPDHPLELFCNTQP